MTTELKILEKQVEQVQYWTEKLREPIKIRLTEETFQGAKGVVCDMCFRAKHGTVSIDVFQSYEDEVISIFISNAGYPDKFEGEIPSQAHTWEGRGYRGGHVSQSHWDTTQEFKQAFFLLVEGFKVVDTTEKGHVSGYYPKLKYWKE